MKTELDKATTSLTLTSLIQRCESGFRRLQPMLTWPCLCGAALLLLWLYLLPFERSWFSRPALFSIWVMEATIYQGAISFLLGKRLAKVASTLRQIRSPSSLWRYRLARTLLGISLLISVSCLAVDVIPMEKAFPKAFSGHIGLFYLLALSPVASLAMLFVLSDQGLLHRFWRRGILFLFCVAVVALLSGPFLLLMGTAPTNTTPKQNFNIHIPLAVGIALAMTWPVLVSVLWLRWRKAPPLPISTKHSSSTQNDDAGLGANWLALLRGKTKPYTNHLHRYVSLLIVTGSKHSVKLTPANLLFVWLITGFFYVTAYSLGGVKWHQQVTGVYLVFLFIGTQGVSILLIGKDLNWRNWLVPGGTPRHQLGTHLLKTNLVFYGSSFAVFASVALLIYVIKAKPDLATLWEAIWQFRTAPLEFSLCIALGILLRATAKNLIPAVGILIGLFLVPAPGTQNWLSAPLFPLDYSYLASLIVLNIIAFALINKVWTVSKVLPVINKQFEANTHHGARHG